MTTYGVYQNNQNVYNTPADALVKTAVNPLIRNTLAAKRQTCCQRFAALPVINRVIEAIIWLVKKIFPCLFKNALIEKLTPPLSPKQLASTPKQKVKILTVKLQNVNPPSTKPVGVKILLSSPEPKGDIPFSQPTIVSILPTRNSNPSPSLVVNATPNTPPTSTRVVIVARNSVLSPLSPTSPKSLPTTPQAHKHSRHLSDSGISWKSPPGGISPIGITSPKLNFRFLAPAQQSPKKDSPRLLNASIPDLTSSSDTSEVSAQEGIVKINWLLKMPSNLKPEAVKTLADNELSLYTRLKKPGGIDLKGWSDLQTLVKGTLNQRILSKLLIDHPSWKSQIEQWTTSDENKIWLVNLYELFHLSPKCVPKIASLNTHVPSDQSLDLLEHSNIILTQQTLDAIEEISISGQKINKCPEAISLLTNLKKLTLSKNELSIPPDVSKNSQLTMLMITDNPMTAPPDVRFNSKLESLHLSNTKITQAPEVSCNEQLKELILSGNPIGNPPNVSDNAELKTLVITNCNLIKAPDVKNNPKLECLILNKNNLQQAPGVTKNALLRELNLAENQIVVPPDVSRNGKLTILWLSNNKLVTPPDVGHNANLEILNLNDNKLSEPPNVSKNAQLQKLHLRGTYLRKLPDLSQNKELTSLDISGIIGEYFGLTTAPDIRNNRKLEVLILDNNDLAQIDVTQNVNLQILSLTNNHFLEQPDLSHNPELTQLLLEGNYLRNIDFSKNPKLQTVGLATNCFLNDDKTGQQIVDKLQKDRPGLEIGRDISDA